MSQLSKKDQLFLMVGRCLTAWNQIEERLLHLIEYAYARNEEFLDEIAHGYWAVVSFDARLKWCSATINIRTSREGYEDLHAEWNSLHTHLTKKAQKRAEVAHGSVAELYDRPPEFYPYFHKKISIHNRNENFVVPRPSFSEVHNPLSVSDLEQREAGFRATEQRIIDFARAWRERDRQLEHHS